MINLFIPTLAQLQSWFSVNLQLLFWFAVLWLTSDAVNALAKRLFDSSDVEDDEDRHETLHGVATGRSLYR